jgi:enamine deaminase RidA (YjgF/YER057c/UK114 family)
MIAGQGGESYDGSLSADFTKQVRQALVNLNAAAKAAGGSMQHIVKHTMLVVDFDDSKLQILAQELERAYEGHKPTGTLIPVPRLALSSMLFEIDAVLALPSE